MYSMMELRKQTRKSPNWQYHKTAAVAQQEKVCLNSPETFLINRSVSWK